MNLGEKMTLKSNLKNILLVIFTTLLLSACSTAKKTGDIDGDVYTGKDTVEYLASGVPDRVLLLALKDSQEGRVVALRVKVSPASGSEAVTV